MREVVPAEPHSLPDLEQGAPNLGIHYLRIGRIDETLVPGTRLVRFEVARVEAHQLRALGLSKSMTDRLQLAS